MGRQTIEHEITVDGVGLHTGEPVQVILRPGQPERGVGFVRGGGVRIPAHVDHVVNTRLATTLGQSGETVSTVEHLLSAIHGRGIDDLDVCVDGPELPCLDGSAQMWMDHLQHAGRIDVGGLRKTLVVDRTVRVTDGERWVEAVPAPALRLELVIDFPHPLVGRQEIQLDVTEASFASELAWARTFGFMQNVEALRRMGLIRGGNLDNAIVFGDEDVLNPGGLVLPDEPVRHKALDLLGDVALLGIPVQACFRGERPGHSLVIDLLRALLAEADAWHVNCDGSSA